jgi:hypothetical protein
LTVSADALVQSDYEIPQSIRDLASNVSYSSNSLYNLLASCVSDQVSYVTVLSSFDIVSDDYENLLKENSETGANVDLNAIYDSFNDLANALR